MNNVTKNDIRTMATLITTSVNSMCNCDSEKDITNEFIKLKDLIIALYKKNIERVR